MSRLPGLYNFTLIFVMCSIWAGNYFVIKYSIAYSSPILFALLRSVGAGLFLLLISGTELRRLSRRDIGYLALIGLFQVSIFYITLNVGLETVNSSVAATLVYTQPVLVVALSPLVGERLTPMKVVGVVAAFIGVGTIFLPDLETSGLAIGDALELIASLSWVVSILIFKSWKHTLSHYTVPGVQNMIGALFILPFLPLEAVRLDAVPLFWVYLAYITILGSGISYAIYFRALSRMQASVFTSYLFMVPVLTTVFQSIITLTLPGAYEVIGTVLVSAGIIIVNRNFMG